MDFTDEQIERYSRHILLSEVGGAGQAKLLSSGAFVVGAGGLGSPALLYLAASGVGRIGVADGDAVELSNLHRQIIHRSADIGRNKAESARDAIAALNPDCEVAAFAGRLSAANIADVVRGYGVVLDCSDNFPTRFLVSDFCRFEKIPLVSAAVVQMDGQLMTVMPGEGYPCYRCFVPEMPPRDLSPACSEAGVLGAAAGAMGALQAVEALKVLLGFEGLFSRRLMVYDARCGRFPVLNRAPNPDCPLCGSSPSILTLADYEAESCESG